MGKITAKHSWDIKAQNVLLFFGKKIRISDIACREYVIVLK